MEDEGGEIMNSEKDKGSGIGSEPKKQPNTPDFEGPKPPVGGSESLGGDRDDKIVGAVAQAAIDIVSAVDTQGERIGDEIKGLRTDLQSINDKLFGLEVQSSLGEASADLDDNIDQLKDRKKPLVASLVDAMDKVVKASEEEKRLLGQNERLFSTYIDQTESQIPAELRNPTIERMKKRLSKKDTEKYEETRKLDAEGREVEPGKVRGKEWNEKNEAYQEAVEDWFEERIREMETIELSFEEQQESYRYLSLYANNFVLKEDTRPLGEKMREKLETRRIRHRVVRIWNLAGPEGILGEAGRITTSTFAKFFKTENIGSYVKDKNGNRIVDKKTKEYKKENQVEKELQNYERMMRILREKKDELRRIKLSGGDYSLLEKEIDIKERYIIDYFRYGGSAEDEGIDGAYTAGEKDIFTDDEKKTGKTNVVKWDGDKWNGVVGVDERTGIESNDNKESHFYKMGTVKRDEKGNIRYEMDKDGNYIYKMDKDGNYIYEKDENGHDLKDVKGNKIKIRIPIHVNYFKKDLIKNLLDRPKTLDDKSSKRDYRDDLWARRYAGGLSSMMFRITREAQLNGSGDFYANRILNFADKLSTNALMRGSKGIWDPETGSFKGEQFDIGYIDIMSDMLKKANLDDLKSVGLSDVDKEPNGRIKSLETLDWGSDDLWDDLIDKKLRTPEGQIVIRMTYFNDADNTRKKMWGADSFFHRPTLEGMVNMEGVFGHMGTGNSKYEVKREDGSPMLRRDGQPEVIENISGIEKKWIELLDRSLEYLKTNEAREWLGDPTIGYARTAEIRTWINSAIKNGTINGEERNILLRKHLGTDNAFLLNRMSEISILANHVWHNRGTLAWQSIVDFLRRTFGIVFSDEVGRG